VSDPALPYHERPLDETPIRTEELPPTPTRDRAIVASAWIEAPEALLSAGEELGTGLATYKRRIGDWLLWRSGPASKADAIYVAVDAGDLTHILTFRLFPDGSGDGVGPSGSRHSRFRSWKEDLLGRPHQ
jgi:hypothetical protein